MKTNAGLTKNSVSRCVFENSPSDSDGYLTGITMKIHCQDIQVAENESYLLDILNIEKDDVLLLLGQVQTRRSHGLVDRKINADGL